MFYKYAGRCGKITKYYYSIIVFEQKALQEIFKEPDDNVKEIAEHVVRLLQRKGKSAK